MADGTARPALIVVSGPPGSGKTTLAHEIARAVGCPAVCRDEIKEGMAHASPGFAPGEGDELTVRTLPVFFAVLKLLLEAGVTTVAEAAFQDRVWRPHLQPFIPVAAIRVVHCTADPGAAFERAVRRHALDAPRRRAHPGPGADGRDGYVRRFRAFDRVRLGVPGIEVDTTSGYRPGLEEIVAFAAGAGGLDGSLRLDDETGRWLPAGITLRQPATHTSGLPRLAPSMCLPTVDPANLIHRPGAAQRDPAGRDGARARRPGR